MFNLILLKMKKLKRFTISSGVQILDPSAQMCIHGGDESTTDCSTKEKSQCSGKCVDSYGYYGYCGWTAANLNKCTCGTASLG